MRYNNTNKENLSIEKSLPHNFLAEKIILSILLINSETINITLRNITVETFYFKNHQELYKAMVNMYKDKIPIDIITLSSYLQDNGLIDNIGGLKVLIELINNIPSLLNLQYYINLIQEKFIRRSLIKLGYELINSSYITNIQLTKIINNFETKLIKITSNFRKQTIFNTNELFANLFLDLKQKSLNPGLSGVSSGFYELDSFTQGFQKSDLIVIAGRPSMGKTSLSLNMGLNVIKNTKLPVLFFNFEMSKEQLLYRFITNETNIPSNRLKTGSLYKQDWIILKNVIEDLSKLPIFIDDSPNPSLQDIRSQIKKIILEQNHLGLIIIDYLQLMQYSRLKFENRVQEISQITRFLKTLAREFSIPVIILSQLSRNIEIRTNKRPILSDLRESGSIEQDADLVMMLYKEDYYNSSFDQKDDNNLVELIIAKQRNGPIGTIKLKFDNKCTKFLNYNSKIKNA